MPQWALDSMQLMHIAVFAVVCISVEWRRPGLILLGFALLYSLMAVPLFGGLSFNMLSREYDSSLFMLMWTGLDMLGAAMIFHFCRPGQSNTSYTEGHRLALTALLIAFWVAHYLNFMYTMGYTASLATPVYDKVTIFLALLTPVIVWPGIKEGACEIKAIAMEKMAGYHLPDYQLYTLFDTKRHTGTKSGPGHVFCGPDSGVASGYGRTSMDSREKL